MALRQPSSGPGLRGAPPIPQGPATHIFKSRTLHCAYLRQRCLLPASYSFRIRSASPPKMFEARLIQGSLLKKVLEAIKDLVTDANFDCSAQGFALQAMDSSHVSLVSLLLRADGFEHYRCDRGLSMGMNLSNFAKMLKVRAPQRLARLRSTPSGQFKFRARTSRAATSRGNQTALSRVASPQSQTLGCPGSDVACPAGLPSPPSSWLVYHLAERPLGVNECNQPRQHSLHALHAAHGLPQAVSQLVDPHGRRSPRTGPRSEGTAKHSDPLSEGLDQGK